MVNFAKFVRLRDDCHMRREEFGVLIYLPGGTCVDVLPPIGAFAFALLDGKSTIEDIGRTLESILGLKHGSGESFVNSLIVQYQQFLYQSHTPSPSNRAIALNKSDFIYDAPLWHDNISHATYRLSAPITLTWITTRHCNLKCAYCYVDSDKTMDTTDKNPSETLDVERICELLVEAQILGVASVMITGGEPLLVKDIFKAIRKALQLGISIELNTNGSLLGKPSIAESLKSTGITDIMVSIDTSDPKTFASLCGTTVTTHDHVLKGIRNCLANGIEVKTNTTLAAPTISKLASLIDLLAGLGVRQMLFSHYVGSFHNRKEHLFPSLDAYHQALIDLEAARKRYPDITIDCPELKNIIAHLEKGSSPGTSRCDSLKRGLVIFPDGRSSFCDTLVGNTCEDSFMVGDIRKQSITDIWASSRFTELLNPSRKDFAGTICEKCYLFEKCMSNGHCYSRALIRYGSGYAPDPFCPKVFETSYRLF